MIIITVIITIISIVIIDMTTIIVTIRPAAADAGRRRSRPAAKHASYHRDVFRGPLLRTPSL